MKQAIPLTDRADIAQAYHQLRSALRVGAEAQDGGHWTQSGGLWYVLDESHKPIYCLNLYAAASYTKTLELNFERTTPTKMRGGLFVSMPGQGTFVAHSGRLFSGKSRFVKWYRKQYGERDFVQVAWSDRGGKAKYILIGRIGSHDLERHLTDYIAKVHRFRHGSKFPMTRTLRRLPTPLIPGAAGRTTTSVTRQSKIQVRREHSSVVHALARMLQDIHDGSLWYDRERDLLVGTRRGPAKMLFEVKTDRSTTSIYTGVGQLMLHGANDNPAPLRVLVMPGELDRKTTELLLRLKVRVLGYSLSEGRPRFSPQAVEEALR